MSGFRRVTALKVQKRNPQRVNVYLDGEYAFGLARIVAAWLQIGQELGEEKIAALQRQDEQEVALQRALRLLNGRPRSEAEVQRKLVEKGFSGETIREVVERLKRNNLLGDDDFARTWVENRSTFRPRGRRLLKLELRHKGVAEETIEKALEGTQDASLAEEAASRYARRVAGDDWLTYRKRMSAFLLRRGFDYQTVGPLVHRMWQDQQISTGRHTRDDENGELEWEQ